MAGFHMLDVSELHGEAARLHAWVVTSSGPQKPSVVQPLKCARQHLPLVVLMVHQDRCPEGTTSDPRGLNPLQIPSTPPSETLAQMAPDG